MEVNRKGDTIIQSRNIRDSSVKENEHQINMISNGDNMDSVTVTGDNVDGTDDRAHLIETDTFESGRDGLIGNNQAAFDDAELYKGFRKITTIPAAALSIVVSFIMIASVCKITG